jgi:aldehyde:ferredoxin oxidoreductase
MGMDTITAGNLVAFAIEASKAGKIEDKLEYGDADGIAQMLNNIAYRRGVGRVLSEGVRQAAVVWGMEERAIHVKGLEPAGFDPRVLKGWGWPMLRLTRRLPLEGHLLKWNRPGQIDPSR